MLTKRGISSCEYLVYKYQSPNYLEKTWEWLLPCLEYLSYIVHEIEIVGIDQYDLRMAMFQLVCDGSRIKSGVYRVQYGQCSGNGEMSLKNGWRVWGNDAYNITCVIIRIINTFAEKVWLKSKTCRVEFCNAQ